MKRFERWYVSNRVSEIKVAILLLNNQSCPLRQTHTAIGRVSRYYYYWKCITFNEFCECLQLCFYLILSKKNYQTRAELFRSWSLINVKLKMAIRGLNWQNKSKGLKISQTTENFHVSLPFQGLSKWIPYRWAGLIYWNQWFKSSNKNHDLNQTIKTKKIMSF